MICTLTARRIKPGTEAEFKAEFSSFEDEFPEEANRRWTNVYFCRDVADENVILTFGMFDGTLEELRSIQSEHGYEGHVAKFEGLVEEVLLDGSYEVITDYAT